MDDQHIGQAEDPLQIPSPWYMKASIEYAYSRLMEFMGIPDITTASELMDYAQRIKGMSYAETDHSFTEDQIAGAERIIKEKYEPEYALTLISELHEMDRQARQVASVSKQETMMIKSPLSALFKLIAETGKAILIPGSDHNARTEQGRRDEPRQLINLFSQVYVDLPDGERKSVSDFMNPSRTSGHGITGYVEHIVEGLRIYCAHKLHFDGKAHLKNGRLGKLGLTAHRHHAALQVSGDTTIHTAVGQASAYNHINEAGYAPTNQGISALVFPEKDSYWAGSASAIFGGIDTIILNQGAWREKLERRRQILDCVPSNL
jgi:hypothetical protein